MDVVIERKTKETQITLRLDLDSRNPPRISTGLPFFEHLLTAFSFHGGFYLEIMAQGDLEVDAHHLVEDVGLVLGMAFQKAEATRNPVHRWGFSVIPVDESLSEVVIDVCNRPTCVYKANYPQTHVGTFDLALIREFLIAFSNRSAMSLHALCRYGENAHHMVESLFKALGKACAQAYAPSDPSWGVPSTKGSL